MSWDNVRINEIAGLLRNGKSIKQSPDAGGMPITRIETIASGSINLSKCGYADLQREDCSEWLLEDGDILISHINSLAHLGKCAIFEEQTREVVHGMNLLNLRINQSIAIPRYVLHALRSKRFRAQISRITKKSVNQASFNISTFKELEIPLPPLEEQRRIAAILDRASELEALSVKQSKLLEDCEKHLFLECFGLPFPGRTSWPVTQLSQLGSLERGVSKHRPRNDPSLMNGPYPFIQTGDVAGCRGKITSFSTTYSEKGLAQSRLWEAGTLCITIAANIAKTGILDFDACFPDSIVGFQNKNPAIITYVQCWMSFLQSHIEQMAPESAQKNINLEILRGLTVPVPSEDKLEKFHAAILLLRNSWSTSMYRYDRIKELKSSLQSATFSTQRTHWRSDSHV